MRTTVAAILAGGAAAFVADTAWGSAWLTIAVAFVVMFGVLVVWKSP